MKMAEYDSDHGNKVVDKDIWFVFICVSVVTMLDFGIIFAFGALFVNMMETFQSDRASAATVQSLLVGISLGFSVVSGALISRFGLPVVTWVSACLVPLGFVLSFIVPDVQYLYATISIISGSGISTIHVMSIVFIQQNFPTNLLPLCFAIHGVGVNLAGIFYPLLIEKLLDTYTVHGTFLILGGLFMNTVAVPILLLNNVRFREKMEGKNKVLKHIYKKPTDKSEEATVLMQKRKYNLNKGDDKPTEVQTVEENTCNHPNLETGKKLKHSSITECQFILLLIASASSIPALNTFLGLIVDIFRWKGFTVTQGQLSFVPFNVFSILSKFIPVLAKRCMKRLNCFVTPLCFCVIGLLSQALVYVSGNYIVLLIGTSCVGLSLGGVFPAMLIAGAKIVSGQEWPVASGLLMTVIGILSSGLGPLFGLVRDITGTYTHVIIIIGILQTIGILLFMCALLTRKQTNRSQRMGM